MQKQQIVKHKPPLTCRWFGHKPLKTGYMLNVFPFTDAVKEPLWRCKRCRMGFVLRMYGWDRFTPDAVETFIREQEAIAEGKMVRL